MAATASSVLRTYWKHARKYSWMVVLIVFGVVSGELLMSVASPWMIKRFVDALATIDRAHVTSALPGLFKIIWILFAIRALSLFAMRLNELLNNRFQSRVMAELDQTSLAYLLRHSYQFFSDNFAGSLVRRVNRLSRSFEDIADALSFNLISLFVGTLGILVVIFLRNIMIGWLVSVAVIVFGVYNFLFARWKLKYDIPRAAKDSEVTGVLSDSITNSTNIKLFTGYAQEEQRFFGVTDELRRMRSIGWDLGTLSGSVQQVLMITFEIIVLYLSIGYWQQGKLSVGDFVLFYGFLNVIYGKLRDTDRMVRRLYSAFADAKEMVDILETPHGIRDRKGARPLVVRHGKLEFQNVSFSYQPMHKILNDFSLTVKSGERVAFVGQSGAGKSTIVKILFRFYDVQRGRILIDGQAIRDVTQDSLRDAIAIVPQEPILFHRTLLENIRYGRHAATDEEVIEAAKLAHCHEFISQLPYGYQTYVGERGVKLSGGERQRVAIARAILKNAPILVLDEATSSLDSESEAFIQDALQVLMRTKTVLVIAHRLSTIMQMDRIVVMEDGRVVDQGTHSKLVRREGIYQKLWSIQAGGFIGEESTGVMAFRGDRFEPPRNARGSGLRARQTAVGP